MAKLDVGGKPPDAAAPDEGKARRREVAKAEGKPTTNGEATLARRLAQHDDGHVTPMHSPTAAPAVQRARTRASPYLADSGPIDFAALRAAYPIPEIAGALTTLHRNGSEWIGLCPLHKETTPSFTIYDGGLKWKCFGCLRGGDNVDLVMAAYRLSLRQAALLLVGGHLPSVALDQSLSAKPNDGDSTAWAKAIWGRTVPAQATPVERYLLARAIDIAIPETIRFARLRCGKQPETHPCLVAAIMDVTGEIGGIHRIFLNAAGTGKACVPAPKRTLGRVHGGAIRLAPAAPVVTACEGVEDGLSLLQIRGGSVWASGGTGKLVGMQFPDGVREIVIGADNDPAGREAARNAAQAFRAAGLKVSIITPDTSYKDFNDQLSGCARHGR